MTRVRLLALVVLGTSTSSFAQALPLAGGAVAAELGVTDLALPALQIAASRGDTVFVSAFVDGGAGSAGLGLGAQWSQPLLEWLSLREVVEGGPRLALRAPNDVTRGAAGGLGASAALQLVVRAGDVDIVAGPRVAGSAIVDGEVPGRLVVDGVIGVRVPLGEGFAITGVVSGGQERSLRGFVEHGAVVSGSAFVGVQWTP